MKKVLITGITGFAGSHLAEYLTVTGAYDVTGTHISDNVANIASIKDKIALYKVDLQNASATEKIIGEVKPGIIFHLAALTHPGDSFKHPVEFITNNIAAEVNVLEAVRKYSLVDTKIIIISSSHTYGLISQGDLPINETVPFRPDNPYSVSKITQDYLGLSYYLAYKLHIVRLRPFNHLGSRLSADISVSRWAKTIAEIEKGIQEPILRVGNLTAKRDFTDVRDMVRAYALAAEKCIDGEAYNIGTGVAYSMQEMLDKLLVLTSSKITVESDQSLFRPSDIPELRADATKFSNATDWKPEFPIERTLQDTLDYWRGQI